MAFKKPGHITLLFKNELNCVSKQRFRLVVSTMYYAVKVIIIEKTLLMLHQKLKQHVIDCITSHYLITYMCAVT